MFLSRTEVCYNLPPAFEAFEEISNQLMDAIEEADRLHRDYVSSDFYDSIEFHEFEGMAENRDDIAELRGEFDTSFFETLKREMKDSHFEIFGATDFVNFTSKSPKVLAYMRDLLTNPEPANAMVSALRWDDFGYSTLMHHFGDVLSPKIIEASWDAFKEALTNSNRDWVTDDFIKGAGIHASSLEGSSNPILPWAAAVGGESFITAVNAPERVVSEASFLFIIPGVKLDLSSKLAIDKGRNYAETLRFKARGEVVRQGNPDFFWAQIKKRGIDSTLVDMMLISWAGDFESFLASAKTLSADF